MLGLKLLLRQLPQLHQINGSYPPGERGADYYYTYAWCPDFQQGSNFNFLVEDKTCIYSSMNLFALGVALEGGGGIQINLSNFKIPPPPLRLPHFPLQ